MRRGELVLPDDTDARRSIITSRDQEKGIAHKKRNQAIIHNELRYCKGDSINQTQGRITQ